MSIYDSGLNLNFGEDAQKKIIYGAVALFIVLVIAALGMVVSDAVDQKPLQMRFEKSPIKAGETAKLFVTVANTEKTDASNVEVKVEAKEKTEFDAFPLNEKFKGKIDLISAGTSREISYILNPIGKVIPGTYTFAAKASINGKEYTQDAVLKVEQ
ncbi:Uncharacterised protein [uncultured archaeon]|nr:Uncharacterised protein [uncultured archaeon]